MGCHFKTHGIENFPLSSTQDNYFKTHDNIVWDDSNTSDSVDPVFSLGTSFPILDDIELRENAEYGFRGDLDNAFCLIDWRFTS